MNCEESVALLSEFHVGTLDETTSAMVSEHLARCLPCAEVLNDIDTIVVTASALRAEGEFISFPDENVVWQRLTLSKRTIH